jgi:isocitrate dehydrogenase (NAD+)
MTDGMFLKCFRKVAEEYPDIESNDYMVDAACYMMAKSPERLDVLCAPNQYGDIMSDLAAGLVGSMGLAPGANIGEAASVFEASHGAAPDIAGKGIANPAALILSGALMLRHVGKVREGQAIEDATYGVMGQDGVRTPELGGTATTAQFSAAVAKKVQTIMGGARV